MPVPKFIFVRHGEATHNVAFREVGQAAFRDAKNKDAPLTEVGVAQAKGLGKALAEAGHAIVDIWSSPLTRAIQTTQEIFEETDAQAIFLHDSLLEKQGAGYVCHERKKAYELKETYPAWSQTFLPEFPPFWISAEPDSALYQRMLSFVLLLAHLYRDKPEGQHVVIVSHGIALQTLMRKSLKNAEYAILSLEEILNPAPSPASSGASSPASSPAMSPLGSPVASPQRPSTPV
jgi:broad specificity phosphatase PhoE